MAYYTGYEERDVSTVALTMVDVLTRCLRRASSDGKEKGVVKKFRSRSTHQAVIKLPQLSLSSIEEKVKDLLNCADVGPSCYRIDF